MTGISHEHYDSIIRLCFERSTRFKVAFHIADPTPEKCDEKCTLSTDNITIRPEAPHMVRQKTGGKEVML